MGLIKKKKKRELVNISEYQGINLCVYITLRPNRFYKNRQWEKEMVGYICEANLGTSIRNTSSQIQKLLLTPTPNPFQPTQTC